jgi:chemotaxis protein MotB
MAQTQPQDDEPEDEAWLVTYADAVTLLMAFFIMLVSFSKIDVPVFEKVKAGIQGNLGSRETIAKPIENLKLDLQDVVFALEVSEVVKVGEDEKGIVLELDSSAFFPPGSAEIRPEAEPVLASLAQNIGSPAYRLFNIDLEGHTDDDPIDTPKFPSNWELSAHRAAAVVRFLIDQAIERERLQATGYAETRPKSPNRDADGNPIPENQAENRRVVVRLYPMSMEERGRFLRAVEPEKYAITEEKTPSEAGRGAPEAAGGETEDKKEGEPIGGRGLF